MSSKSRRWSKLILLLLVCVQFNQSKVDKEGGFILEKSAQCDEQRIYFNIAFSEPFRGLIYSDGHYGDARCTFVNGTVAKRYQFWIPIQECQSTDVKKRKNTTTITSNSSQQHSLIVQRDVKILSGQDQLLFIICSPAAAAPAHLDSLQPLKPSVINFDGVKVDVHLASQQLRAKMKMDFNYTAEIQLGDGPFGAAVDKELSLGERLSYVVRIRGPSTNFRIGRCWASDQFSNLALSDDRGCPLHSNKGVWSEFQAWQVSDSEKVLFNKMKAWAFPTSNQISIYCNLQFCGTNCTYSCQDGEAEKVH
ncbi:hypothetical protein T4B_7714 [Trichinella pseudospiralis]|uniref:ZP domain-containing protein n=1 Tax=Trichinella pseudospiralis TaxID=6337 RepID=A0A0V1HSU9_TRIPS|nr:hypothetical protein T4A_8018 [Trichinella pseudospiralis]KRZ13376.1 hypothetical protein T4B_7714 [Trichinella pseudospiralis]KRZ42931.1 hypothetical protein T4C_10536 [Trichinella pseudospiralis]